MPITGPETPSASDAGPPHRAGELASPALSTLLERRAKWNDALSGNDRNAIEQQLRALSTDFAMWQVVNDARRMTPRSDDGTPKGNVLFHSLFDRGFVTSFLSGIRRLCDSYGLEGKRGVYSLRSVLDDMLKNKQLLTRGNILEAEGYPYEYQAQKDAELLSLMSRTEEGPTTRSVEPWDWSEVRHEFLDWACRVQANDRSRNDRVDPSILETLKGRLVTACEDATLYVNKFIAHAATEEAREGTSAEEVRITIQYLSDAHRVMCETAAFLTIELLHGSSPSFIPAMAFDHLEHLDEPLVATSDLPELHSLWKALDGRYDSYSRWNPDDLASANSQHSTGPKSPSDGSASPSMDKSGV